MRNDARPFSQLMRTFCIAKELALKGMIQTFAMIFQTHPGRFTRDSQVSSLPFLKKRFFYRKIHRKQFPKFSYI